MTKTILVADDSRTIQTAVTLTFRATQFKVVSVGDGDEALRKVSELKPDLVLADIGMPGKNGYELCSQIKASANTATIPVLLLSGIEPVDDRRASEARADGHMKKPFDSQSLIDRANALTSAPARAPEPIPAAPPARPKESAPAMAAAAAPTPFVRPPGVAPLPKAAPPAAAGHAAAGLAGGAADPGGWTPVAVPAPSPFGAPRAEARSPFPPESPARSEVVPFARAPARSESVEVEVEPEYLESEVIEDAEEEAVRRVPSLEPPRAPSGSGGEPRPKVDVWALADDGATKSGRTAAAGAQGRHAHPDPSEGIEEVEIIDVNGHAPAPAQRVADLAAPLAAKAAGSIASAAAAAVPGLPHDELVRIARDVIERIAWEVVPELAEAIIRAELERLTKD